MRPRRRTSPTAASLRLHGAWLGGRAARLPRRHALALQPQGDGPPDLLTRQHAIALADELQTVHEWRVDPEGVKASLGGHSVYIILYIRHTVLTRVRFIALTEQARFDR